MSWLRNGIHYLSSVPLFGVEIFCEMTSGRDSDFEIKNSFCITMRW